MISNLRVLGRFETSFSYDDAGLLYASSAGARRESYQYDSTGALVSQTTTYTVYPNSTKLTFGLDPLGRTVRVNYPNGGAKWSGFDASGNLILAGSASAKITRSYDARNRLTQQSTTIDGTSYSFTYDYDRASNLLNLTYPDGVKVTYAYDEFNRPTSLKKTSPAVTYATLTYRTDDRLQTVTFSNGVVTTYGYDLNGRVSRIQTVKSPATLLDVNYTYDGVGNVASIIGSPGTERYVYDALDRLNYSTGPWGKITYTYDAAGNRLKRVEGTATTDYYYETSVASAYRLTSYTTTGSGTTSLAYNGGNVVSKSAGGVTWAYAYNYENLITTVKKNGALQVSSSYDALDRRIKTVDSVSSTTTVYLYQGLELLFEKNVGTGAVTKHLYVGGQQVAEVRSDGAVASYHSDALGNTRVISDSNGAPIFRTNYKPFGLLWSPTGTGASKFNYTGALQDPRSGLYLLHARYYDPETGRFFQTDPLPGSPRRPQSLNQYAYVTNNPLRYVDPTGQRMTGSVSEREERKGSFWGGVVDFFEDNWKTIVVVVAVAAVTVATGGAGGIVAGILLGAASQGAIYAAGAGSSFTLGGLLVNIGIGAAAGAIGYGAGAVIGKVIGKSASGLLGKAVSRLGSAASKIGGKAVSAIKYVASKVLPGGSSSNLALTPSEIVRLFGSAERYEAAVAFGQFWNRISAEIARSETSALLSRYLSNPAVRWAAETAAEGAFGYSLERALQYAVGSGNALPAY